MLLVPSFVYADKQGDSPNYFLLTYARGNAWNEAMGYAEQPGLKKHHEYLEKLHINDQLVMGGEVLASEPGHGNELLSVMLLRTGSIEEAEKLIEQDPGVQMRLVRGEVVPWNVTMSSLRFVRRKAQPPIDDPAQSFSIKRVDTESRLNIDQ